MQKRLTILVLGALTTVSPFSIDMYLPAFQKIADHFGTTTSRVSLSISSYFVGLALGQIFYGPLLDRFGRKRPLYVGFVFYIVSSLFCIYARSVEQLIVARFFQALGGCAASVASTAMVRDFFVPEERAKVFSRLILILSVSPLFAPTLGGLIVSQWGWATIFFSLIGIVALMAWAVFAVLPDGHIPDASVSMRPGSIFKTYLSIFKDKQFSTYALAGAFSFAGLFTYIAGAPSIFFDNFRLSENQFGLLFAFLSVGMIGGGQVNVALLKRFASAQIFVWAVRVQVATALVFVAGSAAVGLNLWAHIAILFAYMSCVGLTYPNAAASALCNFSKNAGSASALLGTLQMGLGALAAAVFSILPLTASLAVAVVFLVSSLMSLSILIASRLKPLKSPV